MENNLNEGFPLLVSKEYPDLVAINERLGTLAKEMLTPIRTDPYERGIKFLACNVASAHSALVLLATHGHGAESVTVGRGMFEAFLTFRYLILEPEEFKDFIDFDTVARWKRLQFYKLRYPKMFETFPLERVASTEKEFKGVSQRFRTSKGKMMDHWTRKTIAQIAEAVQETEMYEAFYRYACSLSHSDPMGLTMLVDGNSFEIPLAASWEHVSIALAVAGYIAFRTLMQYNYLLKLGFDETLRDIEVALKKSPVSEGGKPLGWFQHALLSPK